MAIITDFSTLTPGKRALTLGIISNILAAHHDQKLALPAGNDFTENYHLDNGHKALMPVITPRVTGHNARNAPGILGQVA